jgi:hypothetical protein
VTDDPVVFRPGVTDLSRFSNVARRRRALTPQEQAIYDEADLAWALLSERARETVYIQLLDREIAQTVIAVFTRTAETVAARQARITDPFVRDLVDIASRKALQNHWDHLEGYQQVTAIKFAESLSRPMAPPPPPPPAPPTVIVQRLGFWDWLSG